MLTSKQQRFVEEYPTDCNPEAAAIRAGFSKASARQTGQRLMRLPAVQAALLQYEMEQQQSHAVTRERVLQELAGMAFANGSDFCRIEDGVVLTADVAALPAEKRAAIQTIREGKNGPEIVAYDKLKALELLGKHLGLFDGTQQCREREGTNLLDAIRAAAGSSLSMADVPEAQRVGKEDSFAV